MLEKIKEYVIVGFISGLVGGLVALPFILTGKGGIPPEFCRACLIGLCIGIVSRAVFAFLFNTVHSHPIWAFVSVFIIIGIGTFSAAFLSGLVRPFPLILMVLIAEGVGMILCVLMYRYSRKLNKKLKEIQETIPNH